MNQDVDNYFISGCGRCPLGGTADCKVLPFETELRYLRSLLLSCGLTETCKWGVPCYMYNQSNILLLTAFKNYGAINFFKGALLADTKQMLEKPGPNSQAGRFLKFSSLKDIQPIEADIKAYIFEAIEIEKAGLKMPFKTNPEPIPEELERTFEADTNLKAAFEALTPGRQRGYILHFSQPKKSETRYSRIEKCTPLILNGIGLNDRYKAKKKSN